MSDLLWGADGAILLTYDHRLIQLLFAVCSDRCMFIRCLCSSCLILSILVFPAAFPRYLVSVVVNICLTLLVRVQFYLCQRRVGVNTAFYDLCVGGLADLIVPEYIEDSW